MFNFLLELITSFHRLLCACDQLGIMDEIVEQMSLLK